MALRYDIRLSGSGGQGIILMGIILAEAIGIYDGRFVAQTQSYGPEARGGSSKAEVVVSDSPIDYPKALQLDLLVAMNQRSCDDYYMDLKPDGILVVDSTLVKQVPLSRAYRIPFTRIAREELKRELVANIVALGDCSGLLPWSPPGPSKAPSSAECPKGRRNSTARLLRQG
jgi:2-oxoglutarate ferredoxin oxidoreductase subunit gamma